ncbi:MAG: 5'-methylthioadenosine/S-adenosylhomocysteine nucleosidase [Deltaproteobacteria bacterium]|nr:5'-methylthioadenosine/S-adenosylhomocysteine nucleosidase [Candidatus Anaeroferrophillacea bacterium]
MSERPLIGIVTAFRHELRPLLAAVGWDREDVDGRSWYRRDHGGLDLVATSSGLGKVMAAATTQQLIAVRRPRLVINFGSAGGLVPELAVGAVVLSSAVIEYDFASLHRDVPRQQCAPELVARLRDAFPEIVVGPVASADRNADQPELRARLHRDHGAVAADWEGAAVVRVAHRNRVPALVFRGITDVGEGGLAEEFTRHADTVLAAAAATLTALLDWLAGTGADLLAAAGVPERHG